MPPRRTWPNASSSWLRSDHLPLERLRTLGDHDDRRVLALEALLDVLGDLVDVELALRQQDDVRATGEAGVQRDPAGVPAHHLDDERAVVRLGRRVQPVDRLHRDVDSGVEAERVVGRAEVVVDRLRYADDVHAQLGELRRDAERVLATDRDERVDTEFGQVRLDLFDATLDLERVRPGRAEDRAAAGQDAPHLGDAELLRHALERAAPTVPESDELVTVDLDALADDRANDRVQPGAVAATSENTNTHSERSS